MTSSTQFLIAQVLLTLTSLPFTIGLIIADLNKTHATNPLWTGHARFHVVWQTFSYTGFGLVALGLIWWPGALHRERLWLAALFAVIIFGSFLIAMLSRSMYGGAAYDDNGVQPIRATVAGIAYRIDVNAMVFSVFTVVLLAGAIALAGAT